MRPVTLKLTKLSCASMFPESFNRFSAVRLRNHWGWNRIAAPTATTATIRMRNNRFIDVSPAAPRLPRRLIHGSAEVHPIILFRCPKSARQSGPRIGMPRQCGNAVILRGGERVLGRDDLDVVGHTIAKTVFRQS